MSKVTAEQQAEWSAIVGKNYAGQAVWFLNGFWDEMEAQAEDVWKWVELFGQLDQEKHADGCELDEFWSHKFLESLGETMTVIEMREKFRTIDVDFNKRMSLIEFLSYRFKKTIQEVIDAPQGGNQEEISKAQAAVDAAQAAVDEMVARLAEATRTSDAADAAAAEATRAANAAQAASDEAEAAAAPYRAAVAENEQALDALHAEEKAFNDKKEALEKAKSDMSAGVVKRNKAANELDQLLAEDPLPLRKAKINQAATVRKMEKAAKPFNEASAKAKAAAEAAEAAKNDADAKAAAAAEAKAQSEAAAREAEAKLQAAVDTLTAVKKQGGVARGAIWWMERSIEEKRKYMPGYKGPRK